MAENNRGESLARIRTGLEDAEAAIRQHPDTTVSVYESNLVLFGRQSFEWASSAVPGLTVEDARVIDRYMLAMSFMSAWYHLHGDKAGRDIAAQSAATLVSAVGFEATFAFKAMLHYEGEWRRVLSAAGIRSVRRAGCAGVVLFILAGAGATVLTLGS